MTAPPTSTTRLVSWLRIHTSDKMSQNLLLFSSHCEKISTPFLFLSSAMCFRNAKSLTECKDCLLKCADCHRQNRSLFHSAKALDQAMMVCKDLNDFSSIRMFAERACNLYQQHGSPESGAASLDKAAKILEPNYPQDALALYQQALDVSMVSLEIWKPDRYFHTESHHWFFLYSLHVSF